VLVGMFDTDIALDLMKQAGTVHATAMLLLDMIQLHSQPTGFSNQSAAAIGPRKIVAFVSIPVRTAFTVSVIAQAWLCWSWCLVNVSIHKRRAGFMS